MSPTSRSREDDNKIRSNYNIKLVVGTPQRSIEEQDSGNYSCVGKDNPELSVAVYIFVPGKLSFHSTSTPKGHSDHSKYKRVLK